MFDKLKRYLVVLETLREKKFSRHVNMAKRLIHSTLTSSLFSSRAHPYLAHPNENGEPFTAFSSDPLQISQVKKVLNALYHAEVALKDIENNVSLAHLWNHTLHHIYLASHYITHVDIDLNEIFRQELDKLAPMFVLFHTFAREHSADTSRLWSQIKQRDLPNDVGVLSGVIVNQMSPHDRESADYEFLTQFSASLPGYLDRFSGYIRQFSSKISAYEPTINQKQLDELQDHALKLLNSLDGAQGRGSLFLSMKVLHYIHIIRHTVTLSMSIIKQVGHLTDSGQDAIREKLAELKYTVLPSLFGLADKIEEQTMLTPGTLSRPLMRPVSNLYNALISHTKKIVNFEQQGKELCTVEDARFVFERLEYTYKRFATNQKALLVMLEVQRSAKIFFMLINANLKSRGGNTRLLDLPDETRALLIKHYKVIQPYVLQVDAKLNNEIIDGLMRVKEAKPTGMLAKLYSLFIRSSNDTLKLEALLEKQGDINNNIIQAHASHEFHAKLNYDIILAVATTSATDLQIFPFDPNLNPFEGDEAAVIGILQDQEPDVPAAEVVTENKATDNKPMPAESAPTLSNFVTLIKESISESVEPDDANPPKIIQYKLERPTRFDQNNQVVNLNALTLEQALTLYQAYQTKCLKLEVARHAYSEFCAILTAEGHPLKLNEFNIELKQKLRHLYGVFQPYFVAALFPMNEVLDELVEDSDRAIVTALSASPEAAGPWQRVDHTLQQLHYHDALMIGRFDSAHLLFSTRCAEIKDVVRILMHQANDEKQLEENHTAIEREHYVIKHQEYSKGVADFRQSLEKLLLLFTPAVRERMVQAENGLPYPELDDPYQQLKESGQSLGLKRLFNGLYYLEQICITLEKLDDTSYEHTYAMHILQAIAHLREVIILVGDLASTPTLSIVATELRDRLQTVYTKFVALRNHYIPDEDEEKAIAATTQHKAISYILNVIHVLPEHITALLDNQDLSPESIQAIHKHTEKLTVDLERVITNSHSYFKLFLEVPSMWRLFKELKRKLTEMSSATHQAVIDNLDYINNELFTSMLLEADLWEDNLSLNPGTLSKPMKEFLDSFYQGLLEPLGLSSQRYLSLVSSNSPLEKRIDQANKRIAEAEQQQQLIVEKLDTLQRFQDAVKAFRDEKKKIEKKKPAHSEALAQLAQAMKVAYVDACPILQELKKTVMGKIEIAAGDPSSRALDSMLNHSVAGGKKLKNIPGLTTACAYYLQGVQASQQIALNTANEKMVHLNELKGVQFDLNTKLVEKYTTKCFKKQLTAFSTKEVGLVHYSDEYNQHLATFLQGCEAEVVHQAKHAEDIDQSVSELMRAKVAQFEQSHYINYYQLERVRVAIGLLITYVSKSNEAVNNGRSIFENERTVAKKSRLVKELRRIAEDQTKTIPERLQLLRQNIARPIVKTTLLECHRFNSFTWGWLKQCFAALAELLWLFTPSRKKCFKQLEQSQKPSEAISKLSERFGLFSAHRRKYNVPHAVTPVVEVQASSPMLAG